MEQRILNHLRLKDYVPADVAALLKALRLKPAQQSKIEAVLRTLERSGQITRIKGRRYVLPRDADLVAGRIQITRNGRGFLAPDDPGVGKIAIRAAETGTALHDDHVLVRLDVRPVGPRKKTDAPPTGSVIRVIERRRTRFVGSLREEGRLLYVVPDDPRFPRDIAVPACCRALTRRQNPVSPVTPFKSPLAVGHALFAFEGNRRLPPSSHRHGNQKNSPSQALPQTRGKGCPETSSKKAPDQEARRRKARKSPGKEDVSQE